MKKLLNFIFDDNGQGMAEYALIVTFIAVALIVAVSTFGNIVRDNMNDSIGRM